MAKTLGIDVSKYQQSPIDWQRIRAAGYEFAFVRYGHGDGTNGSGKDPMFDAHYNGAKNAGLLVGTYWYMWPTNIPAQVSLFTQFDPAHADLPMALDVEQTVITEAALKLMLSEIKRVTGRRPIIYTRQNVLDIILGASDREWLKEYDFWLAEYPAVVGDYPTRLPKGVTNWQFWQFTDTGRIPGYSGDIDINYFNGSLEDLCCRYRQPKPTDISLVWPVDSPVVTQEFGNNPAYYGPLLGVSGLGHEGIDFRAPTGANIYACADGIVKAVFTSMSYGINVRIDHQNGYETVYAHLQQSLVAVGQRVTAGQKIALADNTGYSSGSHLHLTVKLERSTAKGLTAYPNDIINPTSYLKAPAVTGTLMQNISGLVLNIRAEPSITSADIGDLPAGAVVMAYPPAVNDYLKITYEGIQGYALAKHFEPTLQAVRLRSTAQPYVNIRSGPGTNYADIGDLLYGAEIMGYPVQGQTFWRVIYNNADAWVASQYLEIV